MGNLKSVAVFLVGFLINSGSSLSLSTENSKELLATTLVSKAVSQFAHHFNQAVPAVVLNSAQHEINDISFPVLPPLPDPMELNDTEVVIPEENDLPIYGYTSSWDSAVTGLSTVVDLFTLSPTTDYQFLLKYLINFPHVSVDGQHDTLLTIRSLSAEVNSTGDYSVAFTNASVGLAVKVKILLENALEITDVSVDLAFDQLVVSTSETTINGEPINWEEFSEGITEAFPAIWEAMKPQIDILLQFALNTVLSDCKLTDLINGDLECITGGEDMPELLDFDRWRQ